MAKKTATVKAVSHASKWADESALKKYYKKMSTDEVIKWVEELGTSFKESTDPSIHRMRACMAVLYHFFPREVKAKKSSKYADYSLEQLVSLAAENNVPVEVCDDERILRMRTIMALRAHQIIG